MKIVFMGSPEYAAVILRALAARFNVVGVFTQPDKPVGRGRKIQSPPVKLVTQEFELPVSQPKKMTSEAAMGQLNTWDPDLIVVAAYGKILRSDVLNYPQYGCINVHASLLPRWRGASPVHAAILHGDEQTGVTIMKIGEGLDTGDILSSSAIPIDPTYTTASLTDDLANIGAELLLDTIPDYINGSLIPRPQNEEYATYAPKVEKTDGKLDFSKPAEKIERKIRAMVPWPVSYFEWNGEKVKIYSAKIMDSKNLTAGSRGIINRFPAIGTKTNDLLISEIQMPGKNKIQGNVFLNGARDWIE